MVRLEKNQDNSSHGGPRRGAGRKAGVVTRKTREVAEKAAESGLTPLDYMLSVLRNEDADPKERMNAAVSAAPYVHAKLASVEHKGEGGGPIIVYLSDIDERL